MSKPSSKSQTSQAYFTAGISGVITAGCLYFFGEDIKLLRLVLPIGALCAPFVTLVLVNIFAFCNVDPALIKYKASLVRDLKKQKKILKDPHVNDETKQLIQALYSDTSMLLATANQDHINGAIEIKSPADNITH